MNKTASHILELRNDPAELRRMSAWIRQTGRLLALPAALASHLDVCASEAVINIIHYAYDDSANHRIHLRLSQGQGQVDLEVEDDGRPFNPLEYPPPPLVTRLEDAPLGGRGIRLIRGLMSECRYHRRDGKNILTMVMRPPAAAG